MDRLKSRLAEMGIRVLFMPHDALLEVIRREK
jgi:hypothetical protein